MEQHALLVLRVVLLGVGCANELSGPAGFAGPHTFSIPAATLILKVFMTMECKLKDLG